MTEDFNLSNKIVKYKDYPVVINVKYIKKFIRLLKNEFQPHSDGFAMMYHHKLIREKIDNLAGSKLIGKDKK